MEHRNILTKEPYSPSNQKTLNEVSQKEGFNSCEWGTYLQWNELNHRVCKGEKGIKINGVYVSEIVEDKQGKPKEIHKTKKFVLFNLEQTVPVEEKVSRVFQVEI